MKINTANKTKIEKMIENVQTKCKSRLIDYSDIKYAVDEAELQLHHLEIPKKYWTDCTVTIVPEKVCNSYNGTPEGTAVTITRGASAWFLTAIERKRPGSCAGGDSKTYKLKLSEIAKSAMPDEFIL
jgi:hypothetical protein